MCIIMQKFVVIRQTVAKILQFFNFCQNGGHPPSLICYEHIWTNHDEYLVVFRYHCAKFGWNQCSNFDNMQVLIFNVCGLSLVQYLIHSTQGSQRPKWRFFRDFTT